MYLLRLHWENAIHAKVFLQKGFSPVSMSVVVAAASPGVMMVVSCDEPTTVDVRSPVVGPWFWLGDEEMR